MSTVHERLRQARIEAGNESAAAAAERYGWKAAGYTHHENGTRKVSPDKAKEYAKAFRKPVEWLLYGTMPRKGGTAPAPQSAPLIGYVAAGSRAHFFDDIREGADTVAAPSDASEETVAVEVRGESLGPSFDRAIVFYDDVRRPVPPDSPLIGKLCVVGLSDGRIMVKRLLRSKARKGLFHLESNNPVEPTIYDVEVKWAARVLNVRLPQ